MGEPTIAFLPDMEYVGSVHSMWLSVWSVVSECLFIHGGVLGGSASFINAICMYFTHGLFIYSYHNYSSFLSLLSLHPFPPSFP